MKTKYLAWLSIAVLPLLSLDCHTGCDDCPGPPQPPRLRDFFRLHQVRGQSFGGRTNQPFHIGTSRGTQFDIPADTYQLMSDNSSFSGDLAAEVWDISTRKDLLLSRQSIIGPYGLLPAQRLVYIRVWQNTVQSARVDAPLTVTFPATGQSADSMQLYHDGPLQEYGGSNFPEVWFPLPAGNATRPLTVPLQQTANGWIYPLTTRLKYGSWFCLAEPWPAGTTYSSLAGAKWSLPVPYAHYDMYDKPEFYLMMGNRLSMMKLGYTLGTDQKGGTLTSGQVELPDGQPALVVGFLRENGVLYFGKTAVTTGPGIAPQLELKEISEANLVAALDSL